MTSLRYRLERELWRQGVKVAVLVGEPSASLVNFPLLLPDDVTSIDVDRALSEVGGRLGLFGVRGAWRGDGLYSLEVARSERQTINLADIPISKSTVLPWLLGVSTSGQALTVDLSLAPHILIAGTTGSGKSNHISGALSSLISNHRPDNVRLALLDPKQVDMLAFADIPHTLAHVTNHKGFVDVLTALCNEMTRRYSLFRAAKVRDIAGYIAKGQVLPRIVCVFDESAAAIDANKKVLEPLVLQLLQTARASGIHLVLAMQRPSGAVLSPTARLNLPLRVAFRVLDAASSRLIIDDPSAAALLGNGDGLLLSAGSLTRFQSPLASDNDLTRATEAARVYPVPTWQLDGITPKGNAVTIPEGLSRLEQAKVLLEHLDWIASSDLISVGIVGSSTPAKALLSELRELGCIGKYDPSAKASPVLASPDFEACTRPSEDETARIHGTYPRDVEIPSETVKDGLDGLISSWLRAVN